MNVSLAKRPLVSLHKPYLTGEARSEALDLLEVLGAVSRPHTAERWDREARRYTWARVIEVQRAYSDRDPQGLSSSIERANYRSLREAFPSLGEGPYWLEITDATRVTPELIETLEALIEGEALDQSYWEQEIDDMNSSAWANHGWRSLRDASENSLAEILANSEGELSDAVSEAADAALDQSLDSLIDYGATAGLAVDPIEGDSGIYFDGIDSLAQTLAAQAAAAAGIEA